MKRFLTLLVAFSALFASAQLPVKDGKVTYEIIDSVPGTKAQIYSRAKMWLATAFKDAKEVVQVDDREAGELAAKGAFRFSYAAMMMNVDSRATFVLRLSARDGRYRAIVTDIITEQGTARAQMPIEHYNDKPDKKINKKVLEAVEKPVTDMLEDLQKKMRLPEDGF